MALFVEAAGVPGSGGTDDLGRHAGDEDVVLLEALVDERIGSDVDVVPEPELPRYLHAGREVKPVADDFPVVGDARRCVQDGEVPDAIRFPDDDGAVVRQDSAVAQRMVADAVAELHPQTLVAAIVPEEAQPPRQPVLRPVVGCLAHGYEVVHDVVRRHDVVYPVCEAWPLLPPVHDVVGLQDKPELSASTYFHKYSCPLYVLRNL